MTTTHAQRLEADLDQIRLLATLVEGDNESALVAGIIEASSTNLMKARAAESEYVTYEMLNETHREIAEKIGEPFEPFVAPECPAADEIRNDMVHLRGMLTRAVSGLNTREARRLVNLLTRAEKRLWRTCMEAGVYLTATALDHIAESWVRGIDKSDQEAWLARAHTFLATA